MRTWEYLIEDDLTIQRLSELGSHGWELVTVQRWSYDDFESGIRQWVRPTTRHPRVTFGRYLLPEALC